MKLSMYLRMGLNNLRFAFRSRSSRYKDFHRELMNQAARIDPKDAVGGRWEQVGRMQLEFLRSQGLRGHHKLLDFGCGSLRGGVHFIGYLDEGNYCGIDISEELIEAGKTFLADAGLEDKRPNLIVNSDLSFEELRGTQFDYVFAQSVYTHMPLEDVEESLRNLRQIIGEEGVFYATYYDGGNKTYRRGLYGESFYYPFATLRELTEKYGYSVSLVADYPSPTGQKMLRIARKSSANEG